MLCGRSVAGAYVTGSPQGRAELVNIRYELTIFHPGPDYAREITLSSPSNGLSNVSTTPVLKWNLSCEVENIDLRIARDPAFAEVVILIPQDTNTGPVNILSINTTYFWQVRVRNTGSIGTYTPAWSFSTTPVGISSIKSILPEKFELLQNYPNPFNPKTRIKFDVPKTSSVTIKIIDLSGKEVMTIVNSVFEAGSYEALIDAANLASGTYFCRMESADFLKTRKIVLIK
ncbi:MAG: T9SS type A sorting domain-containing protein [Ignavibacteria bacterium]|nr:T9SS type A sorting domain-containing protein [Ignavibacteria bacterium]